MREPPTSVSDDDVLALVRAEWDGRVDRVEHLPVGFGAHHWRASAQDEPRLFVTLDRLAPRRTPEALEAAYAGAAALARDLDEVLACRPSRSGPFTRRLGDGALSVTRWTDGTSGDGPPADAGEATVCADLLRRLHERPAPSGTPSWRQLVDGDVLVRALEANLRLRWASGPHGPRVRDLLDAHLDDVRRWCTEYDDLGRLARERVGSWVATHGEPDTGNQLVSGDRRWLVDWESLKHAPRERDLRFLVESDLPWREAYGCEVDDRMLALFDVEWRLDEVSQYAAWFAAPHTGTEDDRLALRGLEHELTRAPLVP